MASINKLKVLVKTANVGKAGTNDDIWFDVGKYRWLLDNPGKNDFERGNEDSFNLSIPAGLQDIDIWRILVCKAPDGNSGGWKLAGIKVLVNDSTFYANQNINQWLEDEGTREWLATDFTPKGSVPKSLLIAEDIVRKHIQNFFKELFKQGTWNNLRLIGDAIVDVECPYIYVKQSFEVERTGPNPEVTMRVKFVPYVNNGKIEVQIKNFEANVDYPLWYEVATLGIANIIEYYIEGEIKSKLKDKIKELLQNELNKIMPNGIAKYICLRPNKVEIFY